VTESTAERKKIESVRQRSRIMASVRSKRNRSTEWRLRGALVSAGVSGWRLNVAKLLGKPDFVFASERLTVFVDGCFWHGCPKCYRRPKSRRRYWDNKVLDNIKRDKKRRADLRRQGWRAIRIWEHELTKSPQRCVRRIHHALTKSPIRRTPASPSTFSWSLRV